MFELFVSVFNIYSFIPPLSFIMCLYVSIKSQHFPNILTDICMFPKLLKCVLEYIICDWCFQFIAVRLHFICQLLLAFLTCFHKKIIVILFIVMIIFDFYLCCLQGYHATDIHFQIFNKLYFFIFFFFETKTPKTTFKNLQSFWWTVSSFSMNFFIVRFFSVKWDCVNCCHLRLSLLFQVPYRVLFVVNLFLCFSF